MPSRKGIDVQPTKEAETGWVETINSLAINNHAYLEACTPGNYHIEGYITDSSGIGQSYAPGPDAFNALLGKWRDAGDLEGMKIQ